MIQAFISAALLACAWVALTLGFWNPVNGSSLEAIFSSACVAVLLLLIAVIVSNASDDEDPLVVFLFGFAISLLIGSIAVLMLDGSQKVDLPTGVFFACWGIIILFCAGFIAILFQKRK